MRKTPFFSFYLLYTINTLCKLKLIMRTFTFLFCSLLVGASLFLSSCTDGSYSGGMRLSRAQREYLDFDSIAYKPQNTANTKIKVSLSKQILYVTEGSKVLLATPVTVGTSSTPTPKGNFTVRRQVHKYRAQTHGWAYNPSTGEYKRCKISTCPKGWKYTSTPMPYWTEFLSASYGIHAGYVYPYPRSHGCIRVHNNVMPKIFQMTRAGTPINIAYSQPEDETVGRSVVHPPSPESLPDDPILETSDKAFYFHKPVKFEG